MSTDTGETNKGQDGTSYDWVFEYILAFLKSPPWAVPIQQYIDEHCLVFDSEEENSFAYTLVHQNFEKLIEELLEKHLAMLGVTPEQFCEACAVGANQEVNKVVFEQILAVDDFLTFKKMMFKRNMELELEALQLLQDDASVEDAVPTDESQEDQQLQAALKMSAKLVQAEAATDQEIADYKAATSASAAAAEIERLQADRERAELEEAIAMSLQLEEARLQALSAEDAGLQQALEESKRLFEEQERQEAEAARVAAEERAKKVAAEAREAGEKVPSTPVRIEKTPSPEEVPAASSVQVAPSTTTTTAAAPAPSTSTPAAAPAEPSSAKTAPAAAPATLAPIRSKKSLPPLGRPDPGRIYIEPEELKKQVTEHVSTFKKATDEFKKSRADAAVAHSAEAEKTGKSQLAIEKRKAFLLAYKKRIVEKRERQRRAELKLYEEQHSSSPSPSPAPSAPKPISQEDAKRRVMHRALADRFKSDFNSRDQPGPKLNSQMTKLNKMNSMK